MNRVALHVIAAIPCAFATSLSGCAALDAVPTAESVAPLSAAGDPVLYTDPSPAFRQTTSIAPTRDGGAVIIISNTTQPALRTLVRLEPDGHPRWSMDFGCDGFDRGAQVVARDDGEIDLAVPCPGSVFIKDRGIVTGTLPVFHLRDSDGAMLGHTSLDISGDLFGFIRSQGDRIYFIVWFSTLTFIGNGQWSTGSVIGAFSRTTGALVFARGSTSLSATAFDVEPSGHVWAGGRFRGSIDFGGGLRATAKGAEDAMLVRFGPDGTALSLRTFGDAVFNPDVVNDVWVGDDGNAYVRGTVEDGISVGGPPIVSDRPGLPATFLASYTPSGAFRWSSTTPYWVTSGAYIHGGHQIAVLGHGTSPIMTAVYSDTGALDHTNVVGTGQITLPFFGKPSSFNGHLLFGGSFRTTATLLGMPLASPDEDPFAVIAVP
jgi:hypothetical protein